jgi:predicted transposase/invertase (TIGR01784 family)
MIVGIDPKVDYAFKILFGREQNIALLIHLLNATLEREPGEQVTELELQNPFQDKDFLDDKLAILDIKARDQSGRQFNVEMQMLGLGAFRPRVLYYWATLHSSQLQEGENYHRLRPTVTICFVNTVLFPELAGWHGVFELRERQAGVVFSDQVVMHVFELPKFALSAAQLKTPLERWLYFLIHGASLDPDHLPAELQAAEIQRALGELQKMTQSELERERYESRLKWQRDVSTALAEAEQKGHAQGRLEGRVEGRAEGHIAQIHMCQRLLGQPLTPAEQLQALPLADLERLTQQLEADLAAQ